MEQDPIKYALWIGGFALAITLACGVFIAWINGGSRNLALGLGALAGACVILVLQLVFELKGSTTSSDFALEFVVDYQQKDVRSSGAYNRSAVVASSYRNLFIEADASKVIADTAPSLTKDDAPKVAHDLGIVSIVAYLLDEQPDWQLDTRSFKSSIGTTTQWVGLSAPKECSSFDVGAIREKLKAAGNIFAGIKIGMRGDTGSLCLPPHTVLNVTKDTVAIRNFVCSIIFSLQEPFSSMSTIDPNAVAIAKATGQYISAERPTLPDGSPRYETVVIGARATVEFSWLRAQDRDLLKYQKWSNRVVEGAKARFEVPQ
jgi:uncharacterized lipoprotein YbaY